MNKSEEYSQSKDGTYASEMAKELKAKQNFKITRPLSEGERMDALRLTDPEAYKAWRERPMPTEEQWKGTTPERDVSVQELILVHSMRQSSKNTQGDFASIGLSSATQEKKDLAVSAFTCSPSAKLTQQETDKLIYLNPIPVPLAPEVEEPKAKDGFFKRLFKKKKVEIDKTSIAYHLYKISGGRDEDFK